MFYFYLILCFITDLFISFFSGIISLPFELWKSLLLFPVLFLFCLIIHLIVFILVSFLIDINKKVTDINNFYRKFMISSSKLLLKIARVKVNIDGYEKIPDDKKFLLVCNHISSFDPIVSITYLAKKKLAFVSKKENLSIPFAGKYIHASGCVGIDRENNREAVKAIKDAVEKITDEVCAIGIYPEGKVNKTDKKLLSFRNGAFKIALKAKVPIVVSIIKNTAPIKNNFFIKKTEVELKILKILPYEFFADMKTNEISEKVYDIMISELQD